jgi:dTDP-4-amino-4,6-dideoxygalactose transaminase
VDYNLQISSLQWTNDIQPGDLVILIHYFGFADNLECAREAKRKKAWVLADASQALLTQQDCEDYDFVLYSPRKFLGVPDGGILNSKTDVQLGDIDLRPPLESWWLKSLSAAILRREFDRFGGERPWFQLFRESEINSPIGPYTMSDLSNILLRLNFDYPAIAEQRRENYQTFVEALAEFALFPELPEDVVPLGFPVRMRNRDEVREALFSYKIYPPVHWPMHKMVPKTFAESYRLSNDMMTLPCDQRYKKPDIQKLIEAVREVQR